MKQGAGHRAVRLMEMREQIAAGMASLRAGKGIDNEIHLAALDTELAELERLDYLARGLGIP